jgi:dnd system-associated protein 4
MKDRVRPPRAYESEVLDALKELGVFQTKQKGMMFAAAVGYGLCGDRLGEVGNDQLDGEGIRLEYFRDFDDAFIDALAVTVAGDLGVMAPAREEERVEIFEKYAYLGLREMKRACFDERPQDPLLGILALIDALTQSDSDELPGLSDLI